MGLPDKIIRHRKAKGWSQEDFAEKMGVSRQAVSRWENGTALPDAHNILQISKLFGVSADYLLNDDYASDSDIPVVRTAAQQTEEIRSKKKHLHLVSAVCFTLSAFCALMALGNSVTDTQLACSCFSLALCAGNAAAQFVLFFRKE